MQKRGQASPDDGDALDLGTLRAGAGAGVVLRLGRLLYRVVFLGTVVLVLAAVVGLAPLAVVRPLAAAFGRPVVLAGVACSGATLAAWGAAFGVASLLVVMLVSLCRDQRGHGHESLNCATEASGFGRCHGAGLAIASLLAGLAERRKTYPIWNMACAD
jgi:hypothetical protein